MWAEMPVDVLFELVDPRYAHLTHHNRATYNKGCRGPLCRKEEREEKERLRRLAAAEEGRTLRTYKKGRGDVARDELLTKIFAWHKMFRSKPRELQADDQQRAMREWLDANQGPRTEVA